ncbi:DEAD/DEAH box helicase family protein [Kaistella anthropi]|nr:DEAD/DEAH box helicase family protein [Kaistella anthropi]
MQPDPESGRVYDALSEHLNLQTKDTTVINIGVGQGKTYTILKTVQKYFTEHPDTYIIVAVPYVSLVSQYVEELIANGIPENQIYKYEWLNPKEFPKSTLDYQLQRRVHVVTANCLLGNAGENAAINSRIKRKYLKEFPKALNPQIIKYDGRPNPTEEEMEELFLNLTNSQINDLNGNDDLPVNPDKIYDSTKLTSESLGKKKVIFIFDELHDAVHNFTAENILHLYLWKDVLHKIFVLSATYNDPSLVVINKLSELTDEKIKIIEATRKQIESKLSDLHIHFDNSYSFKENEKLKSIIQDAISQRKSIDILCYSKKLAENIYAGEVGALLRNYSPNNVKLCVSELIQNQRTTGKNGQIDHPDSE